MRRPVKPFVTEYRGGVRRQGGSGQSAKIDLLKSDPDAHEPWAASPASLDGRSWQPAPEDGYEAALRAADALFSGGRQPAPGESGADAGSAAGDTPAGDTTEAAGPGGGRVLRVLDEPVSEEMLRLEAEYAPKKRGRKPGSKNKPKVPVAALALVESDVSPARPAMANEALDLPAIPVAATTRPALTVTRATGLASEAAAPRGERYAWVRTRLKPGEQWKRRLPKVAW